MRAVGLDGFSRGWVAVTLDGPNSRIAFCPDIAAALATPFDRAAVDIPIGMTEDGTRLCDQLAQARLRPHHQRVFLGARRWLWTEFRDADAANAAASARGQKRISRQLWHIGRRIMEVDAYVQARPDLDIREAHPELVFLRLHGRPLPSKKTEAGLKLRRILMRQAGFSRLDDWLGVARIGTGAKADDVLDACALALVARDPSGSVPEGTPPLDPMGLRMQIWF